MAKKTDISDYYQTLRARFAGKAPETSAQTAPRARFRMPADPVDGFSRDKASADEAAAPRLFDPAGVRPLADDLSNRITVKGRAETTLLAYGLRLAIALFWLSAAGWYLTTAAQEGASALARMFFIIAGAGAGAAILGGAVTLASGNASARRTREEAVILGQRIALETHSLDHAIGHRGDAVSAEAFLKSVSFADADAGAHDKFRDYLKRDSASPGPARAALFLAALLMCIAAAGALGLGADPSVLPLSEYPLALSAVIGGAGLYTAAGLMAKLLGQSWRARRDEQTEAAAFTAMRSAFTAARGVAPTDLSARLHAGAHMAKHSLDDESKVESVSAQNPDWRGRDSAPRFVDTGFQAAPRAFRTDAFEKKFRP